MLQKGDKKEGEAIRKIMGVIFDINEQSLLSVYSGISTPRY